VLRSRHCSAITLEWILAAASTYTNRIGIGSLVCFSSRTSPSSFQVRYCLQVANLPRSCLNNHVLEIPDEDTILTTANELIDSVQGWKQGKAYYDDIVETFSRRKTGEDGKNWFSCVSEHEQSSGTFDDFWTYLGGSKNKAEHEKQYEIVRLDLSPPVANDFIKCRFIKEIESAVMVARLSDTQAVWRTRFIFPALMSPRIFTVLHTSRLSNSTLRKGRVNSNQLNFGPYWTRTKYHCRVDGNRPFRSTRARET
jgi:hypothetical protein